MTQQHADARRPHCVESIRVTGFRSLADVKIDKVANPMVLLGINGAGKSNFLGVFEMLRSVFTYNLYQFVARSGGADDQLFGGSRITPQLQITVSFGTDCGSNCYAVTLGSTDTDDLTFAKEEFRFWRPDGKNGLRYGPYASKRESAFFAIANSETAEQRMKAAVAMLSSCVVYQFHDTSAVAPVKRSWDAEDNTILLGDGANLASILLYLQTSKFSRYDLICRQIQRVVPDFDGFRIDVRSGKARLRWKAKATGKTMGAHLTSDGSLRCFLLITLLNLPDEMLPRIVLLDEPELGLHPAAVSLISHMAKVLAHRRQVIVATQSPYFVDAFDLSELLVLRLREGKTLANKIDPGKLEHWLEDYTTGELWWKGVLGGYP